MKEYGISGAKSNVGFKMKAVPDTASRIERTFGKVATRVGVLVSAFAMVLAGFAPMSADFAVANHDAGGPYEGEVLGDTISKIKICHGTGSDSNPYTKIEPNVNSFFSSGHDSDGGDIIPPFHYQVKKDDPILAFNGMNWPSQKAIWENDCVTTTTPDPTTGTITVTKVVVNDGGGTKTASDFSFKVNDGQATAFEADGSNALTLPFATYTITEVADAGYTTTYDGCANITLSITNLTATCTITNTYTAPDPNTGGLKVNKTTNNGDGTFDFTGSGSIGEFSITTTAGEGSETFSGLPAGEMYSVTEGVLPTGWTQDSNSCDDVVIVSGQIVECEIVNSYDRSTPPTYSISGKVYHDNNSQNGTLDETENGLEGWTVYIDSDESNTLNGEEISTLSDANGDYLIDGLVAGCYTVREVLQSGWNQTEPTEVDDFEYEVSLGGAICGVVDEVKSAFTSLFIKTANAQFNPNVTDLNFGNVQIRRSGGGGGGSSTSTTPDEPGRVLGDFTGLPYQEPQVLGASTELPRTGAPLNAFLMVFAVLATTLVPIRTALKNR